MTAGALAPRAAGDKRTPPSPYRRAVGIRSSARGALLSADGMAALLLAALTAVAAVPLVVGGTMLGQDTSTFFYPTHAYLGERLRSGDLLPGWNPHLFSGMPLAADPQSGWMYLPAMLFFTLLPLAAAANVYIVFHLLLAGLATYALARALGMARAGALLAGIAFELSGLLYGRSPCCPNYTNVMAWLPLMLLGAELAIRSRRWASRLAWWGVAGFGISQALGIWLGQGAYYALLALGGFILYRTVVSPPPHATSWRIRPLALLLHGGAVLLWGAALAAGGLLPRLEFNAVSNLAGGYEALGQGVVGGWYPPHSWINLVERERWYAGGAALALAALAPVAARLWHAVPFFVAACVCALVLSARAPTALHSLLYAVLPRFESLHPHDPERVMLVFYLGAALLAGATLSRLPERGRWVAPTGLAPPLLLLAVATVAPVPVESLLATALAGLLVGALVLLPRYRRAIAALLLLVAAGDGLVAGRQMLAAQQRQEGANAYRKLDVGRYYATSDAARFLQERAPGEPARFFGYDPAIPGQARLYQPQWADPRAARLLVNNRALLLGLEDTQGYNPIHYVIYDEYVRTLNRREQGYRVSYVYWQGLESPLLDLLNARYVVLPANPPSTRGDLRGLIRRNPSVYRDSEVLVIERPGALPRAWLVHEVRRVDPDRALDLLAEGEVDPRRTALVPGSLPRLARPEDPSMDRVAVAAHEPDRLRISTRSTAPGLLVLSEVYDPAWRAYVDGNPARVHRTNHLFRGVRVPAGEHQVEFRYESRSLAIGTAISLLAFAALLGSATVAAFRAARGGDARSVEPVPTEREPGSATTVPQ